MYYFLVSFFFCFTKKQGNIYIALETIFELFIDLPINALYCFNLFVELEKNIDLNIAKNLD